MLLISGILGLILGLLIGFYYFAPLNKDKQSPTIIKRTDRHKRIPKALTDQMAYDAELKEVNRG